MTNNEKKLIYGYISNNKDPEKIKKEVNKEIEESPIPEEEKKDMENGVSNVLNQETVPTPENIEKGT